MGDMELAKQLIKLALDYGGDLAKFQLFDSMKIYGDDKHCSPNFEQAKMLFDYGEQIGIEVFFSVFDVERVQWCEKIGVKRYKIAKNSVDEKTVDAIIATNKPVISSYWSAKVFNYNKRDFLYCVPFYPADIRMYDKVDYNFFSGISDHTVGLECAKRAIKQGARIVEKHFACDHKTGVDAEWSMTPSELAELVRWEKVCQEVL